MDQQLNELSKPTHQKAKKPVLISEPVPASPVTIIQNASSGLVEKLIGDSSHDLVDFVYPPSSEEPIPD